MFCESRGCFNALQLSYSPMSVCTSSSMLSAKQKQAKPGLEGTPELSLNQQRHGERPLSFFVSMMLFGSASLLL